MKRTNEFYGAAVSKAAVSHYYKNDVSFDHFVFQQMVGGEKSDYDDYTLVIYAVTSDGTIIDSGPFKGGLQCPKFGNHFKTHGFVQFANYHISNADLNSLYPSGVNSELRIVPTDYYEKTGYIVYTVKTDDPDPFAVVIVNPSPPAQPHSSPLE